MNTQNDKRGQIRSNIPIGITVDVVLKKDQRTDKLTRGVVKRLLTNSAVHPRGIKVMLEDGQVGRVQAIISK
ncbi:YwbE family protein [Clostridium sp.]|uniref:YwbE family protein n=1 Tax=Clostridium sp. TaxID=1506 RepID=UPI001A6216D0|nr:YwbE family protein [Clostridium sp.]MBK5235813.1 YwbE family protein [Clostridium sp.]